MPLFLLRDGSIRRLPTVPAGVATHAYVDRYDRRVHILLDARSERLLLSSQPLPARGRPRRLGDPSGGRETARAA